MTLCGGIQYKKEGQEIFRLFDMKKKDRKKREFKSEKRDNMVSECVCVCVCVCCICQNVTILHT